MRDAARISGTLVQGYRRALRELIEASDYEAALVRVPADVRERFERCLPIDWVAVDEVETVLAAVARLSGHDLAALNREISRRSVTQSFRTVWRLLLRFTSDESLVSRTHAVYARTSDRGAVDARWLRPGLAEYRIVGRPGMSELTRDRFAAGLEATVRLAGRTQCRVECTPTSDGAAYLLRIR